MTTLITATMIILLLMAIGAMIVAGNKPIIKNAS